MSIHEKIADACTLLGLLSSVLPCSAQAPAKPPARVAVVAPLTFAAAKDEDRRLGESLGEVLAIALADQKNLVVVDRQKLAQVLDEQKLALSGLVEAATAAKVGKLLAAEIVVAGSLVEKDGKLRCAVYVFAVDGQHIVGSVQIDGQLKDFDRLAVDVSSKVAGIAGVKLLAPNAEELDDSPLGRLHLMRGVSFYYANNPDQAISNCLRAVRLDPRLQEARLWIARAYLRQGEKAHARAELKLLAQNPVAAKQHAGHIKQILEECDRSETEKSRKGSTALDR